MPLDEIRAAAEGSWKDVVIDSAQPGDTIGYTIALRCTWCFIVVKAKDDKQQDDYRGAAFRGGGKPVVKLTAELAEYVYNRAAQPPEGDR